MESTDAAARRREQEDLMRKLIRTTAAAIALAAALVIVPGPASAIGYEDSLDDCSYPEAFDGAIMKPLGFGAMLLGAGTVVVCTVSIICPAVLNRDYPHFAAIMVVPAAKFTFTRRIGQCGGDY
jgi:hypothetical protein